VGDSTKAGKSTVGTDDAAKPFASVIVLAHDRRQYIRGAVQSILSQSVPRSQYEIIVVKAFSDPSLDSFLAEIGATSILSPGTPGATKVAAGLGQAHGEVLLLLDDDDLFEPTRLQAIAQAFASDSKLGFFCNQITCIGSDGQPLSQQAIRRLDTRRWNSTNQLSIDRPLTPRKLRRLANRKPDFNASAGAVRREVAVRAYPYLTRLRLTVDTLFFFSSLSFGFNVLLDPRRLTRYRVHGENTTLGGKGSLADRLGRLFAVAEQTEADYGVIRELVQEGANSSLLRLIDARIAVNRLTLASRAPAANRSDFAKLLPSLLRLADTYPVREDFLGVMGSLLFMLSPRMGRTMYQRQVLGP
jgi:glycosyltransferase involved in cell wall biosynthesis